MYFPRLKYVSEKRLRQIDSNRSTQEYRRFKKIVIDRDKCCQFPGCGKADRLEVHHIKTFAKFGHLRTEPFNGIALCEKCHASVQGREAQFELLFLQIVRDNVRREKSKPNN